MANMIPLSQIFGKNRKQIESDPLHIGDEVEFPANVYDEDGSAKGEIVPLRGMVIAIRNNHEKRIIIPKYVVRVYCYSWTQCYFKKCGAKDICRRGRYEELFEVPMRNYATRAQVADYLVEIENTDTESCQYTTQKTMAIIDGFYYHTGGGNSNSPPVTNVIIPEDVRMRGENIGECQEKSYDSLWED